MKHVFDYDPLVAEIDRLARDGHYDTQEWLISRIARACAAYTEITFLVIGLHKHPVRDGSGALGVFLELNTNDLADLR
jgi:dihydroneopterin aldolase